ncbi:coiled-coil domain-containing protein 88B-like [Seriola aureovittata]|uniref:coiled-coil domain-containing protein 88B-like n=1 Tax=Seriola aureovittata TaxID=2871759 RepID=UPI0024BE8B09|nr:coiled-coil domain-containing protein 88B-like [Seriola aureovittata]
MFNGTCTCRDSSFPPCTLNCTLASTQTLCKPFVKHIYCISLSPCYIVNCFIRNAFSSTAVSSPTSSVKHKLLFVTVKAHLRAEMNRQRHQSFGTQQFGAALYLPAHYRPATVPLYPEQQNAVVQGLRDALLSAINEIKSLKEENKSLKDKMDLQQSEWRQVESQLQEEVRQKDQLLKSTIKKRQARTKAHIDVLALLAQREAELESREEGWKARCGALEVSLQELVQRKEDWSRRVVEAELEETKIKNKEEHKSQEDKMNMQQSEWRQVESQLREEVRQKDQLLKRTIKKRQARTKAHIDVLALLAQREAELESREEGWKARCGALEVSLQQLVQREEDWSRRVVEAELEEKLAQKELEETNIKHNEEEEQGFATAQHPSS